ncbi:ribonuclease Z [Muriicola sp.]|uniref:ribonuclease Z n=1 Tax=Muriicola sp. TaxID=2020856 RepID=UPI00356591F6
MIFDKDGNTTIVYQENISLLKFIENLQNAYDKIRNDHIVVNLFSFNRLTVGDMLEFLDLSRKHKKANKSFVLVTDKIDYEDVPEEISLAPTLQEAMDIIEMEDIERDLEL